MKTKRALVLFTWLGVALAGCILAGSLAAQVGEQEGDQGEDQHGGKGWGLSAILPRGGDDIDDLLDAVQVDDPISYKGLTLFPVSLRREYSDFAPLTFDEAIRSGDLIVQEIGEGRVNSVRLRNDGRHPVFILAGEIMSGSKQDRIAQHDILVPARSGWIELPVYCVEAGRWTHRTERFESKGAMANPGLRGKAYGGEEQGGIWSEVDRLAGSLGVTQSEGRALQEVYEDRDVREKVEEYARGLPIPRRSGVVGFVAMSRGRVAGADLFGHPALFDRLRDKLVRSYVLSGVAYDSWREGRPSADEAARFLARAWANRCRRDRISSPGMGESFRLYNEREGTGGGALVYRSDVVHLSLFPEYAQPVPVPEPYPRPMPVPR